MLSIEFTPISDDPKLGIKRAVTWDSFIVHKKEKRVQLTAVCHYFERDDNQIDGYGKAIITQGLKPFEKHLFASNERKVNPLNGKECKLKEVIVGQNPNGSPKREFQMLDTQGNQVASPMGQFDYFLFIIRNVNVVVNNIIQGIILEEDNYYKSFNN